MHYTPTPRYVPAVAALLLAALTPAQAQVAPVPSTKTAESDNAIVLSPFTITSENDNGYAATETLAGTRLRTNLRDVASSMFVLTAEMLRDLGANSIEDAINFVPSGDTLLSSGNVTGNGSVDTYSFRFGNGQQYSIRGVQVGGGSSDFFSTQAPSDFYATESVTVARGPNSILFGTGGPAGVTLNTTKRAMTNRTKGQVSVQTDRWGSVRTSVDLNQVLIKDKLALRFNALDESRNEFRVNEGQWQKRLSGAITVKPTKTTTITLLHENWKFDRNAPPLNHWYSSGILNWVAAGRPTVDFVSADRAWNSAGRTFVDASGRPVPVAPGVVDADGFVDAQSDFDPKNVLNQNTNPGVYYLAGLGLKNPVWNLRFQPGTKEDTFDGVAGFGAAANPQSLSSIFPIPADANITVGSKERPGYESTGQWSQAFFEQKLATGLYLELAGNFAESRQAISPLQDNFVRVDVAKYLPDNSLNPGYLQPYTEIQPQLNKSNNKSRDLRATLSYELDATRWNRWLGRHNFSGLYQSSIFESASERLKVINRGSVGQPTWATDPESAQHFFVIRRYFVNGNVDNLFDPKTLIEQMATLANQGRLAGSSAVVQPAIDPTLRLFAAGQLSKLRTESKSFAWQGYWLKERLVTTFGVRKDAIDTRSAQGGRTAYDGSIPVPTPIPNGQSLANYSYYTPTNGISLPLQVIRNEGTTRTFAGVVHATSWLSLTYNQSANFTPVGSTVTDIMGRPLKNSEGATKDVGLKFFLLNNRLTVSTNYFENGVLNKNTGIGAINAGYGTILSTLQNNYKLKGDSHFTGMLDAYPIQSPNVATYSDVRTQGYELSITFNPNRNWRMLISGSKNNIQSSNLYPDHFEFLYTQNQFSNYTGIETWKKFQTELQKVANGQVSSQFDLNPNDPVQRQQATNDANTLLIQIASAEKKYSDAKALEGAVLAPNGEYAMNGIVNYSFTDGKLKGLGLGMSGRWRSAPIAGYYRFPNTTTGTPEGVLNVKRPIKGDAFTEFGGMASYQWRFSKGIGARVQLNIENLFDQRKDLLRSVGTDSNAVFGQQYAYVPLRWELRRPRNFKLSMTLDF